MRRWCLGVGLVGLALAATTTGPSGAASSIRQSSYGSACKTGTVAAVIAGKHQCLKVGQRCAKALDRQYHRYGFHCHSGVLTKAVTPPKPQPTPPPTTTPTLPGQRVDIGGYRLYIECSGTGSPTVILDSGLGDTGRPWATVQAALATDTRVCSYDRAGLGFSDKRPVGIKPTVTTVVHELHTLLGMAGIGGPYVVAGHSIGGLNMLWYTATYPDEVAGIVFVDAADSEGLTIAGIPNGEQVDFTAEINQLDATQLGSRPTVVLQARTTEGASLARRSSDSILVQVNTGHYIQNDSPNTVIQAVQLVINAVRSGGSLPPCEQANLPAAQCLSVP